MRNEQNYEDKILSYLDENAHRVEIGPENSRSVNVCYYTSGCDITEHYILNSQKLGVMYRL